jgi:hypothetical protein
MLPEWHSSHTKEGGILEGEMLPPPALFSVGPQKAPGDWISRRWESRHQGKEWTIEGGGCWMDSAPPKLACPLCPCPQQNHNKPIPPPTSTQSPQGGFCPCPPIHSFILEATLHLGYFPHTPFIQISFSGNGWGWETNWLMNGFG